MNDMRACMNECVNELSAGMVGQAGGAAAIEEASFSHIPSQAAPHKRSSRKSVAGNALRILSSASQVGATQQYMYAWLSSMMYNLVLGLNALLLKVCSLALSMQPRRSGICSQQAIL